MTIPTTTTCPFCGLAGVENQRGVLRRMHCRANFFVTFSRFRRKSPARKSAKTP
jgi:hypothetical protein